jgi:hypothetical protein
MTSSLVASIMSGLSTTDIEMIGQLLKLQRQRQSTSQICETTMSLVDDYSSDDEEEFTPKSPLQKRSPGRPKKVRTLEEISAMEAKKSSGKPRGRPMKVRTEEELAEMERKVEEKEQRRVEREIKDAMKSDEDAAKQHRIKLKKEASLVKKAEVAEKALAIKAKRTEIHEKMLLDAAEYKAKWDL